MLGEVSGAINGTEGGLNASKVVILAFKVTSLGMRNWKIYANEIHAIRQNIWNLFL